MSFSVMPDLRSLPRILIRGHPEIFEKTGFRLSPEWHLFMETTVYGRTLINLPLFQSLYLAYFFLFLWRNQKSEATGQWSECRSPKNSERLSFLKNLRSVQSSPSLWSFSDHEEGSTERKGQEIFHFEQGNKEIVDSQLYWGKTFPPEYSAI